MTKKCIDKRGITLIALVITIIILLILAGVTIVSLTGEDGLIIRARRAKEETEKAELLEKIQMDILENQVENNGGTVTKVKLKEILDKYFSNVPDIDDFPDETLTSQIKLKATKEYGEYEINLSDIYKGNLSNSTEIAGGDTPVFNPELLTIGEAINTDKYGYKVTNYNVTTDEFKTGVWRLFYQDSNYTYIITDEYVGDYSPYGNDYILNYDSGEDVSIVGQKLCPMISSLFTSNNVNLNIRALAWLTDTSNTSMWNEYKNDDVLFAIGSPTLELFVASYNSSNKLFTILLDSYGSGYKSDQIDKNGQIFNEQIFSSDDNYGIYYHPDAQCVWLGAPGGGDVERMALVGSGRVDYSSIWDFRSVRPVVCISTSVFNSKYTLANE